MTDLPERTRPRLSVVVISYRMPHQALNTVRSFAPDYQRDVSAEDYEVILIENRSDRMTGREAVESVASNVRYFERDNVGASPVPSLVFGMEQARGDIVGLVIDGARMVTPRVISNALAAFRITPHAVVAIPGYHLGSSEQHRNPDHDEATEQELLDRIDWQTDGYRLFAASVFFRGQHQYGYLLPLMESNCVFFSRADYDEIGGVDLRFDMPGGGMVNLDLYKRLVERDDAQLFVTPGEGTFHQYHGGVTTTANEGRDALLHEFREQYAALRGSNYTMPQRIPRLIGAVPGWAMPALEFSAARAMRALPV